jgi:hypothetical protein
MRMLASKGWESNTEFMAYAFVWHWLLSTRIASRSS